MTTTNKAMSIQAAARRLGVSIRFVYDLVWSGKLPAHKVDKVWKVDAGAVEARRKRLSQLETGEQ